MKKFLVLFSIIFFPIFIAPAKADFGDADFPEGIFRDGPKSYHDTWCRFIKAKCRVRFQGQAMWVEGAGGIFLSQLITFKYDVDGGEYYNYVVYKGESGKKRTALFLFSNVLAQGEFMRAFLRWKEQDPEPIPNYRFPNSQGPQDTQGKDEGLNPYDNPPIKDWSIKTNEKGMKGNINCDSSVWKNKPRCN